MLRADSSARQDSLVSVVSKEGLGTFKGQLQGELATAASAGACCRHVLGPSKSLVMHNKFQPLQCFNTPCHLPAGSADTQAEVLVLYHYFENPGTCMEDEEVQLMRTNLLYFLRWAARSS